MTVKYQRVEASDIAKVEMSGASASGRLVVVERSGREARSYPLRGAALATLGSDPACDIRVLLPSVARHHATIAVHAAQTVIRNVEGAETLVNGQPVSVAALRHGDVITLADRHLRWEYDDPTGRRQPRVSSPSVRVVSSGRAGGGAGAGGRSKRRGSDTAAWGPSALHRDRALHLALEMNHRASMPVPVPGSSGGKQVAIVQPQRRDTSQQIDMEESRSSPQPKRRSKGTESGAAAVPPHTTQATLWIESRKTSPRRAKSLQMSCESPPARARARARARKSTPLRMAVLKRAHRPSLVKIQAPLTIDYTKQAAIMLMTGHTKSKLSKSPSYVVKKPSPVRKTPRSSRRTPRGSVSRTPGDPGPRTPENPTPRTPGVSALRTTGTTGNRSTRSSGNHSMTILEITDSVSRRSNLPSTSTRSSKSPHKSPALLSPKKSALKDTSKKTSRKIESIKFDLSNLENHQESDVVLLSESTRCSDSNVSEEDITLRYSESSGPTLSPSPRRSIHSRTSRMLEKLGASRGELSPSRTLTPNSRTSRRSSRGSFIVQKALDGSSLTDYTKTEESRAAFASASASRNRTRTLSPRKNMESYSIVDLVSLESNDSSVYSSADSTGTGDYGTPQTSVGRRTRSTIDPALLGSSTPYLGGTRQTRSKSNLTMNVSTRSSISTRRSKSLTTPENKPVSVKGARVSRRSRSRSRINDSDLLLLEDTEVEDSSPKTSKRARSTKSNVSLSKRTTNIENEGTSTPENRGSPVEVGTPVLSIQSLLDSSRSSLTSQASSKRGQRAVDSKRKTIGVPSERRPRAAAGVGARAGRSLGNIAKKTVLRLSRGPSETSDKTDEGAPQPDNEKVTPKSAVKLVPEAVKNKHSTAKKPVSKRSLIDDLNQSDIVKQLFNSPVKRKLSQSMTEFSRQRSFDDEEEVVRVRRPTRSTASVATRADDSLTDHDAVITPERFVSPIQTPTDTPNMSGIKRLFKKNTPNEDLRNVRGVRSLLRTPRTRRSVRNDLTNVSGVKAVFARSPRNRLSDVRIKDVFAVGPKNDLTNVRGVKRLFAKTSPRNDLRNVSGVKKMFSRNTPRNDLTDLRGVSHMYRQSPRREEETADMSGIEDLFHESTPSVHDSEVLFDQLVGRPVIKAVYSKTLSSKRPSKKRRPAKSRSLHTSIDVITNNVEQWLETELQKRLHRDASSKLTKELHRLATDTVQGEDPIRLSRTRNTSIKKSGSETYSEHSLPIKKRSLVRVSSLESSKNRLPIKKRAVVHSTPVKGRVNITMNASELGRVSPIAVLDHARDHVRSSRQMPVVEEKPRGRGGGPRTKPTEPRTPPRRVTRNRKVVEPTERHANKRRNSLVITKKTPVMSPKPDPKPEGDSSNSKKTTRSTRAKKEKTIETPKKTRTRAQKATVVVSKPSPQLKPRRGKRPEPEPLHEPETEPVQIEFPKRSQRGRKTKVDPAPKVEERPAPKRTRKATAQTEPSTAAPEEPPRRTRRGRPDLTHTKTEEKTTRSSKKVVIEMNVEASSKPKRGRPKATDNTEDVEPVVKRTRGRRGQNLAVPLDTTTKTQTKGGKRKAIVLEEIPSKVSKSEASNRKATLNKDNKGDSSANKTVRGRRKVIEVSESPAKVGRSRSTRESKASTTTTTKTIKDNLTEVGKRTRGMSMKGPSKKASGAPSPSPSRCPVRKTGGARAALTAHESVAPAPPPTRAARSRRR